jgi:hypothetical protein
MHVLILPGFLYQHKDSCLCRTCHVNEVIFVCIYFFWATSFSVRTNMLHVYKHCRLNSFDDSYSVMMMITGTISH